MRRFSRRRLASTWTRLMRSRWTARPWSRLGRRRTTVSGADERAVAWSARVRRRRHPRRDDDDTRAQTRICSTTARPW